MTATGDRAPGRPDGPAATDGAGGAPHAGGKACWVDVCDPRPGELAALAERFGLHELAVEDAEKAHQRPKIERFGNTLSIVAKPAIYDDPAERIVIGELLVLVGTDFVISVRHGVARQVLGTAAEGERTIGRDERAAVVHRLLDEVVDAYAPIASGLSIDIREIEADVFSLERTNPTARIYRLKRQVLDLIRNVEPLTRPLDALVAGDAIPDPSPGGAHGEYFRDVADHTRRLLAELTQSSALLSDVLQANLAQVSVAQNEDMRRASAWAAIFLVPTLLAGIWGMNFESMPELGWRFGYPLALAAMALTSVALWFQFWRSGWIGQRRSFNDEGNTP